MFELIDKIQEFMPLYMLVFCRISAMTVTMPILGYATVSVRIRIMIAVTLTIITAPAVGINFDITYNSPLSFVVDIMRELLIGMIIGFGARLIFEGFAMAGSFIGLQMGMAIMNVFDPSSQQQQPIISSFWALIITVFFLVTNSHYFLIETIFQNFTVVHLGSAVFKPVLGRTLLTGGRIIYELALHFAAPAMIFLLSIDVAVAFIARVMPQLNVFFISLPLKIGVGIYLLIISLRIFQGLFGYIMNEMEVFVYTIIRGF